MSRGLVVVILALLVGGLTPSGVHIKPASAATSYDVCIYADGSGSVSYGAPSAGGGSYSGTVSANDITCLPTVTGGGTLQITATPSSGYTFSGWTGAFTSSTNPISVTVNSNLASPDVTANFQQEIITVTQPIDVAFNGASGGSQQSVTVSGCDASPASLTGNGVTHDITMSPSCGFTLSLPSGYRFIGGTGTTTCSTGSCATYDTSYEANCGPPTISLESPSVSGPDVSINGVTSPGGSSCTITSITWAWGDGTQSTSFFPAAHTYASAGTYSVTATTHQSDGQTASASESVTVATISPSCNFPPPVIYSSGNFPTSEGYQDYVAVGTSSVFTPSAQSGPSAISVGVMGGTANVQVSQGGVILLSTSIGGPLQYVVVTSSSAYCYANFDSNGQNLQVTVSTTSGSPLVAYNVYNDAISAYTASLITYPPQFAVNMGPTVTPVNTGISFQLVAPTYSLPTPLAIWVEETFPDSATVTAVQIGIEADWNNNLAVSYFTGLGVFYTNGGFSGGSACPGQASPSGPIALVPGDTYNITLALASGTTWEALLNGQCTQEADLGTNSANGPATLGLETLTAKGGNVAVTNEITLPVMTSFLVNGKWSEPSSFAFGSVGENWYNGQTTTAPGIALWGIAGQLQDSSVPPGSLLFGNSLPIPLDVPRTSSEPLYGDFSLSQVQSGAGIVTVSQTSSNSVLVSPIGTSAFVSVGSYEASSSYLSSLADALLTAPTQFTVPVGSSSIVVYASDQSFASTSVTPITVTVTQPITLTVGESGAPAGTFTLNGCGASPTTILGDGTPHSITMQPSCSFTFSYSNSGTSRYGFISAGSFSSTSLPQNSCASGTCPGISLGYGLQEQLTVDGGKGIKTSPASETNDGWFKYGDSVTVSSDGVYGRSAGTGDRVASWNLDGGGNMIIVAPGTVTTSPIQMTASHIVTFNSVTQYQLTLSTSGKGKVSAKTGPTIAGDTGWYDAGTVVTISAKADRGSTFESWTGSGSGSYSGKSNPASVTMNAPITELATFGTTHHRHL